MSDIHDVMIWGDGLTTIMQQERLRRMSDGQSELCRANEAIAERVTLGPAVKWHDGRQWRTGNRLMLPQDRPGRALVSSFGDVWAVPASWLQPLEIRQD